MHQLLKSANQPLRFLPLVVRLPRVQLDLAAQPRARVAITGRGPRSMSSMRWRNLSQAGGEGIMCASQPDARDARYCGHW
jgi:hypothetical protein